MSDETQKSEAVEEQIVGAEANEAGAEETYLNPLEAAELRIAQLEQEAW